MSIIACPKCGTKNRVDESRPSNETPRCGKCGADLSVDPSHPMTITDANFAGQISSVVPILVDCWATWCPPCRAIAPIIDQLAAESGGRYKVGKLDVDANPLTARQYRIESIPTLLIFKESKLVDTIVGAAAKPAIAARLQKWS